LQRRQLARSADAALQKLHDERTVALAAQEGRLLYAARPDFRRRELAGL